MDDTAAATADYAGANSHNHVPGKTRRLFNVVQLER
jgi:hypothetical protein